MSKLTQILDDVRSRAAYRRARALASSDYKLIADLVAVRQANGLKQRDVAEMLGITQQAVSKIEGHDSDPKLSTVRMYANAVGALVAHVVEADRGQLDNGKAWMAVSYVASPRAHRDSASMSYVARPAKKYSFALAA
ncbi:helix-turn-helix domain-containing protein [Herbiconiux sp. P16]|uniref:helix-turn-helix domain-containing protein n=1 Tax=Herbiconiux wuyangfengii TaxID=3342794 RepID=UPI0035BB42DA